MKVLELPPYYFPEQIASSQITRDLEEALVAEDIEMEIHTPTPTRGVSKKTRLQYKTIRNEDKFGGKIHVYRFWMFQEGQNPFQRTFRYIIVNLLQYFRGIRARDVDMILGASTPPTQGLLCALVKKRLMVPFVYNLQDIFPDSLVNAGMVHEGSLLWKIGRKIEDFSYRNADRIIAISENIKQNIIDKGVPADKITVIPNWVDTNTVRPIAKGDNKLFDELGLDRNKFIVTYAGRLGPAQNVDLLLDAADKLQNFNQICFVIIGDGSEKGKLTARVRQMRNVQIFPLQPLNRVSEVYSLGDVSIVIMKKGAGGSAMPSKTLSIMSSGRPVLASFDHGTELETIINNNRCGKLVAAGDCCQLANQIAWFMNNPLECALMGNNAREFVEENLSKLECTYKYLQVFRDVINTHNGP